MNDNPPALVIRAEATVGGELHELMQANLVEADGKIDVLIACLKNFIKGEFWKGFFCKSLNNRVEFDTFEAYVTDKNLGGMSLTVERLRNLVKHDDEMLGIVNKALEKPHGGAYNPKGVNRHTKSEDEPEDEEVEGAFAPSTRNRPGHGSTKQEAVKRLRKEGHEEIADKVEKGEVPASQAMTDTGLARPRFSTFCDNPEEAAKMIFKKFTKKNVESLINELQKLLNKEENE